MEIRKTIEGDQEKLVVLGRLETATAPLLQAEVAAVPAEIAKLLVDFSGVEYVSSAGLRVILLAHRQMAGRGGRLEVTGTNALVKRTFDIAGFSSILNFV